MERGEVWWAELHGAPPVSIRKRPFVIISSNAYNESKIHTIVAVALTSNLRLAEAPGNVLITATESGLSRDSVAIVSQVITLEKRFLNRRSGCLPSQAMRSIENGLRLALSL